MSIGFGIANLIAPSEFFAPGRWRTRARPAFKSATLAPGGTVSISFCAR
jgi:hypothetical protein